MSWIDRLRERDTLTYWAPDTSLSSAGFRGFSPPVTVKCRWENRAQQATDDAGETFVTVAVVYTGQVLQRRGYVARGDHTCSPDPTEVEDAYVIRQFVDIPALRSSSHDYQVLL